MAYNKHGHTSSEKNINIDQESITLALPKKEIHRKSPLARLPQEK